MENPPQDLGYPVDPGNADEGQGRQTGTRKLVRTTQSREVESSHVKRQEKTQNPNSWSQDGQGGIFVLCWGKETCTDSDSKDRVSKYEVAQWLLLKPMLRFSKASPVLVGHEWETERVAEVGKAFFYD